MTTSGMTDSADTDSADTDSANVQPVISRTDDTTTSLVEILETPLVNSRLFQAGVNAYLQDVDLDGSADDTESPDENSDYPSQFAKRSTRARIFRTFHDRYDPYDDGMRDLAEKLRQKETLTSKQILDLTLDQLHEPFGELFDHYNENYELNYPFMHGSCPLDIPQEVYDRGR